MTAVITNNKTTPIVSYYATLKVYQILMIDYVHIKEQWQEDTIKSLSVIDYFPYTATYWK